MRIGLYFGSFNPIHTGHLIIAQHVLEYTNLQQIWFVVSPQNPLKKSSTLLNEYNRLHLVNLAIDNNERFKAIDIEFYLTKPSYTIDTMEALEKKYPNHHFEIIMGADSFGNLTQWKRFEDLVKKYSLIIFNRPGFTVNNTIGAQIKVLEAPLLEISATFIRNQLKQNKSIKYLLPEKVEQEIHLCRYYK